MSRKYCSPCKDKEVAKHLKAFSSQGDKNLQVKHKFFCYKGGHLREHKAT